MNPLNIFRGWPTAKWNAYLLWTRNEGKQFTVRNRFVSRAFLVERFEQHWAVYRLTGLK